MCILLKLHYVKFDVSILFYLKVIEAKLLGVFSADLNVLPPTAMSGEGAQRTPY